MKSSVLLTALYFFSFVSASDQSEVVVYTSIDDAFARPIADLFSKKTGIKVKLVTDTEETKSTGVVNRLIAEKSKPQADVFWSGDPMRAALLKSKGVSCPYHSIVAKDLPPLYSDPEGHWTGFSSRARVLLVNKEKLIKYPHSVKDLANPKYKGQTCIANPLFGTTAMHASSLFETMGESKAKKFFERLLKNKVQLLSSNGEVRRRVSDGRCLFGVTDTDDALEAVRSGKQVAIIFPDSNGSGTLIIPNTISLIQGARHLNAAKKFIDYLLSPETEKALAEGDAGQIPVRNKIHGPKEFPSLKEIKPMKVNVALLDDLSRNYLQAWVDRVKAQK